jgi:hypothetical protein
VGRGQGIGGDRDDRRLHLRPRPDARTISLIISPSYENFRRRQSRH